MGLIVAAVVALLLGLLAELVAGAVRRLGGRATSWWGPLPRFRADLRLVLVDRDRASVVEAVGAGTAVAGAALAVGAAVGLFEATLATLYLTLVVVAVGAHMAAATPLTSSGAARAATARLDAALVEPAVLVALVTLFLRWHAASVGSLRGANRVLGSALQVGTSAEVTGVAIAAGVLLVAAALRLPPEAGDEAGAHGGTSAAVAVARWAALGVVPLVAAGLTILRVPARGAAWPVAVEMLPVVGIAAGITVLVGAIRGGLSFAGARTRLLTAGAALLLAGAAVLLVVGG